MFVRFAGKGLALVSEACVLVLSFDPVDPESAV